MQLQDYNEYALNVYEKDSNKFLVRVLWLCLFVQIIGLILSFLNLVMAQPVIFYICCGYTLSIIVISDLIVKKYPDSKWIKYFLVSLVLSAAGLLQYAYINDIAIQFIWIFPVLTTLLYYDRNLVLYGLIIASIGVTIVDIIDPPMYSPDNIDDMLLTSIFFLVVIFVSLYFLFIHIKELKTSTDNTAKAVINGTTIINHAIKNEIIKIGLCIENIEQESEENKVIKENLGVIFDSVDHLILLVGNIQSKIQKIEPIPEQINISMVIDECIQSFGPRFKSQSIEIIKNYTSDISLCCDLVHVREVINNIIINSIEAIEHNHGKIIISASKKKNEIWIIIEDNGKGISKEDLPRVVSPLYSTKSIRTINYGLGLTYCYNVMKEHKGNLIIKSEINQGTEVILKFPKAKEC